MGNQKAQRTTGLLDLPAEIRNSIYDLVLNDSTEEVLCPFIYQCSPGKRRYTYSLTQTCCQIRRETMAMWHAGKKLVFAMRQQNMSYYHHWLQRRPDAAFQSIRRVQLEDYQHSKNQCSPEHTYFCRSAIVINLAKPSPVSWRRDPRCTSCPSHDLAVDRVKAVVRTRRGQGGFAMTRERLERVFEAAAW
ncbi:uncharacterized protein LTR77_007952 [Saxophila tyrrhenica]|uniref:F-box domain-containing protein n=1 Tax=Saxophila tyrrhenica TaxID=1690608 RepID=A0AAV9P410_9PEZI|nr:hypothetical protein LTR77_007952 [Saxophila tyrrhenica]